MSFLVLCLLVGSVAGWLGTSKALSGGHIFELLHPPAPQEAFAKDDLTILVLGCDEDRTTGGSAITKSRARSDMMMLARIDFKKGAVGGVSIPRDTLVGFGKYHERKINAYHAIGGPELAKQAVETLLPGVQIDKVVVLNFEGLVDMVNIVGGVPVDVEKNMDWDDNAGHLHIHLKKGAQILDGEKAEEYVRFRHSDSDFARNDRQHHFMLAFKDVLAHHPEQLPRVLDAAMKMLGDGLTERQIISLGNYVNKIPKQNMNFGAIPVHDVPHYNERINSSEIPAVLAKYGLVSPDSPKAAEQ